MPGFAETAMMSTDSVFSPDFLKAGGKNTIGMYISSHDFESFGSGYQALVDKYLKKYDVKVTLAPFHAHSYDAMNMLLAALEKVTVKEVNGTLHIPKQALRDALFATRDFKGITGNLTCDSNGDCADPKISVYQITTDNFARLTMPTKPIWTSK